ncbi:MAG: HDOD domain-containing protein [Bdellovibrionales bacterium]|nr:HDOD domain-containing protein [Bdellovibrionales bacterium]
MSLDVFAFYSRCLLPLTPHPSVNRILELVTGGGETTEDFGKIVALDAEVQHWIRLTVQRLGFDRRVQRIDQMVTLLGQNRVRDVIIGRHIERSFLLPENTLMGELHAKLAKDKDKDKKDAKKAKAEPAEGEEALSPEAQAEAEEPIPALADFQRYLECANRAEEVAISIRNSYPGQAFAGGVIFDYLRFFLRQLVAQKKFETLKEQRLIKTDAFVQSIFVDGLRSGIAANEIMQKISIPHQRIVFLTAMLHNIGKALLLAYDPPAFERAFMMSTGAAEGKMKVDSEQAELSEFDFDHAQAGALFLGRMPFLVDMERSVDFHHNPDLLRYSNPGLYAMACVLRVSGALSKLYQKSRVADANVDKIPDSKLMKTNDFQFLKLDPADWSEIKANYALKLMKVEL